MSWERIGFGLTGKTIIGAFAGYSAAAIAKIPCIYYILNNLNKRQSSAITKTVSLNNINFQTDPQLSRPIQNFITRTSKPDYPNFSITNTQCNKAILEKLPRTILTMQRSLRPIAAIGFFGGAYWGATKWGRPELSQAKDKWPKIKGKN